MENDVEPSWSGINLIKATNSLVHELISMQQTVKFTKSNRVTGQLRQHEFRMVNASDTGIPTGKCCGVSNVKGNVKGSLCKYDIKLTDIDGVQVSLGRISGHNSLQIANLMVTSLLRGDYADNVKLEEIQDLCKAEVSKFDQVHEVAVLPCDQVDVPQKTDEENLQAQHAQVLALSLKGR